MNITAEAHRHQYILQVGKLSALPSFSSTHDMVHLYTTTAAAGTSGGASSTQENDRDNTGGSSYALTFQLERYLDRSNPLSNSFPNLPLNDSLIYKSITMSKQDVMVQIRMASVCYIHSPLFLRELTECLSDFKDYTYNVASSIKHAAKEVARGLVAKRTDAISGGTGLEHSPHNLRKSQSQSLEMNDFFPPDLSFSEDMWVPGTGAPATEEPELHITIDMRVDTPIVFLPRKQTSSEVLMACLGEISIENMMGYMRDIKDVKDQINIRVDKMSLYAVNLSTFNIYERVFNWRGLDIEQLFSDEMFCKCSPVLYDTNLEITIHVLEFDITRPPTMAESSPLHPQPESHSTVPEENPCSQPASSRGSSLPHSFSSGERGSKDVPSQPVPQPSISVSIVMATPCKLVVSKPVYEQILETRHNLTLGSVEDDSVSFSLYSETDAEGAPIPGKDYFYLHDFFFLIYEHWYSNLTKS